MRRPFFLAKTLCWYVELGGKQVNLGKDERFTAPPRVRPKEPPPSIQRKYLEAMQAQAEPEDRRLGFCIAKYLGSLEGCRPNSIRRARDYLGRFLEETGDLKVSKLRAHHVTEFLKDKPWSPNSVRQVILTVNACLNHCTKQDWIAKNPIKGKVEMPPARRREVIMSRDDAERVLAAAAPEFGDVLRFLYNTGCRPIEAREALIEKCDLERGILLVPNKTRKKTGDAERPIFLSTAMIAHLRAVIGDRPSGPIFRNRDGDKWKPDTLQKRMERLCDALGIDEGAQLYSSRHRHISDAINRKKMNPAMVALMSGHKDLKMLMDFYLHHDTEAMRAELDRE